ncbi:MAG: HAD-IIIC family phosphatase, partial [Methylobacteriaceae bacterium]|nr:HAD-IIIC family phosphatase [Methylobacteriaceae bacterium]
GFTPKISLGEYNQVFQTCFDHHRQFDGDPDVIILLWRIEELLGGEFARFITGDRAALAAARDRIDELAQAVVHLRRSYAGTIIVSLPPFPDATPAHLLDLDTPQNAGHFFHTIVLYAGERLTAAGNIRLLDLDSLQRQFGADAAFDARKWHLYRQPYTEPFLCRLGALLARIIKTARIAPKKCIVLDCDNTLWGGIVGEDGVKGIEIGEDFPGSAFRDLQRLLLHWRGQGVLLALASKNNEADVWEVFDQHDGMVLKRDHISAHRINWQPKAANLRALAAELNIGTDSLVFIDDNRFEVEQIRIELPEVACILLDEEPARMVAAIRDLRLFDKLEITDEDAQRADMMLFEQKRSALAEVVSGDDFIASLGLRIDLGQALPNQFGRVAQLINKTNQFNLTTIRRSLEEVEALHASPNWRVYALRVADRFGEYGLVGVAIVEIVEPAVRWRIDTFLLSCRVLGRGVEGSFLSGIAADARRTGASIIDAAFVPTKKNALAANFLAAHGFELVNDTRWTIAAELLLDAGISDRSPRAIGALPEPAMVPAAIIPAPAAP